MTQPKFKKGDRIRCISVGTNAYIRVGTVYDVLNIVNGYRPMVINCIGERHSYDPQLFELVDPVEEAKATLEAAGYTVTPPKPKQKGKVFIHQNHEGYIRYSASPMMFGRSFETIAAVEWEEGQGLDNNQDA